MCSDDSVYRQSASADEVRDALADLDHTPVRVTASAWPGSFQHLDCAGLYSWWVDDHGAQELATGLGHQLLPGRVYAGQTGATKWPSGRRGKATLARRIGGNHLRGRIRGSTFRFTLAAMLVIPLELKRAGPRLLTAESERALTQWMINHLSVAVYRFSNRDALSDLEIRLLAALDPPLNLEGMPSTATRVRLAVLRTHLAWA
jgi:hypothetical protein